MAGSTAEAWAATPGGGALAEREAALVAAQIKGVFGYYALQLGDPHRDLLAASPILSRIQVGRAGNCAVKGRPEHLPFESGSIDLVVVSHLLEYVPYPQHVVRDAHRVLRPEGHLVVLCFNPVSIYGPRKVLDWRGEYPWHGNFLTPMRLRDWFEVLGFTPAGGAYAGYSLPGASSRVRSLLDKAGERWWPVLGASALLHVIKRQPAMRLIKPNWESARRRARAKATAPAIEKRMDRQA